MKRRGWGGGKEESGQEWSWASGILHGSALLEKLQELWRTGMSSTEVANG